MKFDAVKKAYLALYGNAVYSEEFVSFDLAFRAAWNNFDFVENAASADDFAQGMCECWQLTDEGGNA